MVTCKLLIELCERTDFEPMAYSGRFMYGKKCFAIRGDAECVMVLVFEATYLFEDSGDPMGDMRDLLEDLGDFRQDSLGLGIVTYWPHIQWEEPEGEPAEGTEP